MVEMTCVHCSKALSASQPTVQYPKSRRSAHLRCAGFQSKVDQARMDDLILAHKPRGSNFTPKQRKVRFV